MSKNVNKDVARFWNAVTISDPGSCWEWQGNRDRDGYGLFKYRLKNRRAHRVVYGLTQGGQQPAVVMHTCDNPACCNPLHLRGGSQSENIQDKVGKARQARGSRNGRAKLTEDEVRSIRVHLFFELSSPAELARKFYVSRWVIRDIQKRKTWRHVNMFDFDTLFVDAGYPAP